MMRVSDKVKALKMNDNADGDDNDDVTVVFDDQAQCS